MISVNVPNCDNDNRPKNLRYFHNLENFSEEFPLSSSISLRDGRTLNRTGNPSIVWTAVDFVHFVRIMPFFKRGDLSEDIVVGVSVISIFEYKKKNS